MSAFAGPRLPRSNSAWALLAIMTIVPLLGYQQYRWIGRVAEVEAKTSREKLDTSLKAFGDDFDTEITRVHLLFAGLDGQTPADVLQKAQGRLMAFRRLSSYPTLIASVAAEGALPPPFLIDPGPPPALTVPTIFARAITRKSGTPFLVAGSSVVRLSDAGIQTGTGVGMRVSAGIPLQIRIVLDQKYIGNVLLPRLLERHLGRNADQHYDVLVRSAKENSLLLRWGAEDRRPWESAIGIFAVRPDCLLGQGSRTYSIATGPMTLSTTMAGPPTPDLRSLLNRSGNCGDMPNAAAGLWLANIRARPSLSETIDSARRQSLAISFGVMLVLAMAIAILVVSGHRARELAARHEQFATGVSHELRTPLAVISSASENLADGVVQTADQVRQYGKMIHAHSEQLSAMIENALWFARKDARDALEVQDVDVEELVSTAAAGSSRVLEEAGVALERDVGQGLRSIRVNRVLLLHALQNLLTNVARHGSSGKWARVQATREESKVVFTVEDRGDGIPSDEVARVFEPFYRGKGAKETRLAGLGLGLTLVRNIVEAHGGKIELRSKHNRGTTIAFTVPICDSEELNPHPGTSQPRYG
jgi:signal transduction histidine kinase